MGAFSAVVGYVRTHHGSDERRADGDEGRDPPLTIWVPVFPAQLPSLPRAEDRRAQRVRLWERVLERGVGVLRKRGCCVAVSGGQGGGGDLSAMWTRTQLSEGPGSGLMCGRVG